MPHAASVSTDVVHPFAREQWHHGAPDFAARCLRAAVRDGLMLLLLAGVGEVGVRTLAPETSRYVFSRTVTGGHPIRLNQDGLRDVAFPRDPPAGQRRILCVGDSTTFGAGVAAEETYPKQLQRVLDASGSRWFVINGGAQGSSIGRALRFVREQGLGFRPSVVVVGFSPSMISMAGRPARTADVLGEEGRMSRGARLVRQMRADAMEIHVWLHRSYLYVFCDAHLRHRLYALGIIRDRMDKPDGGMLAYAFDVPGIAVTDVERTYQEFERGVGELQRLLAGRQIPLVVLGLPSRFRISELRVDNERGYDLSRIRIEPLARVAELCRRQGVPFVDLTPAFSDERRAMLRGEKAWDDLYIPLDYAHLNVTGHALAAQALARIAQALPSP